MAVKIGPNFSGKLKLFDRMIGFNWKGLQCFRSECPDIYQQNSESRNLVKAGMALLAAYWYTGLTEQERINWNEYASMLGSQSSEVSNRMGAGAGNVIPSRGRLMSGFNAFVSSNMLCITRGAADYPRTKAPIGIPAPTSPLNVAVSYDTGTLEATVTWDDPLVDNIPPCYTCSPYISVWAEVQRRTGIHAQLVATFIIPSAETMAFSSLRCGHTQGSPTIPLSELVGGELRVQMDVVYCCDIDPDFYGGVVGPGSAVGTDLITCVAPV